ncbi:MAG: response regulator transcription factor [Methylacidiphilales bacterium]|nr:response regulator transcription factor [Candidatus Methylacidiphilales bacterium]
MKKQEFIVSVPTDQITVLLVDDHSVFRKSLRVLVELEEDIEVVGEATNGHEAVEQNLSLQPEVIIMDMAMPLLNGLEATRLIMETHPKTRVLMLSANPDPEYIEQAMLSGASGYLIKQSSTQFLAKGIREVLKGNTYFSTSISRQLRDQCRIVFDKGESLKRKTARVG